MPDFSLIKVNIKLLSTISGLETIDKKGISEEAYNASTNSINIESKIAKIPSPFHLLN